MKIVFIAPANSIHTQKWVNSFSKNNEVFLISLHRVEKNLIDGTLIYLPIKNKLGYYLNAFTLHKLIKKIAPNIINVHYASGYGTLARLAKIPPYILNVWGSDVFDFPYDSKFKNKLIRKNLKAAYQIASTSIVMKEQTLKLINPVREIIVTPFGVDINFFIPMKKNDSSKLVIGTVKTMAPKYGIKTLIKAFNDVFEKGYVSTKLLLVGGGPCLEEYKAFANSLPSYKNIKFIGQINHKDVPNWLNKFDIYCALSEKDSESFGVAVIEAEACGLPVIVTDVGGLPEVVDINRTGFIVPVSDYVSASKKIIELIINAEQRQVFSKNARTFIEDNYSWEISFNIMNNLFIQVNKHLKKE